MAIEESIMSLLSGAVGGRVYWGAAPQSETSKSYVVMQTISALKNYHMKGPSGYVERRVQFDCYGPTYTEARANLAEVEAILSGFEGTILGVHIQGVFFQSERDLTESDAGKVTEMHLKSSDAIIHHG